MWIGEASDYEDATEKAKAHRQDMSEPGDEEAEFYINEVVFCGPMQPVKITERSV